MARVFSTNQYVTTSSVPVSGWPITVAAWGKTTDDATSQGLITLGRSDGLLQYMGLGFVGNVAGDPIRWQPSDIGGAAIAETTTGYSTNVWHHLAGRTNNSKDHAAWLDGVSKGTSTEDIVWPSPVEVSHGSLNYHGGRTWYLNGKVFWPAIWNVGLDDSEIAALASGISPLLIRPESLVYFAPLGNLDGDYDADIVGGLSLSAVNSPTWSDDSPAGLIYPSQQIIGVPQGIITPPPQYNQRQILIKNQKLILK